jgi:uncharacterized protein (TIGR03663 family)
MGVTLIEQMSAPKENRYEGRAQESFPPSGAARSRARIGFQLFLLLAVAAFFRFFDLDLKPPHFDEGINGHFVMTIWRDGFYSYDPTNFHGPLYFYLCQLAEIICGRGVESFRMMNAVIAVAVVYTAFQFRRFVGGAAIWAAWFIALSPAFTFYGRYAIHETLFILGQMLFVYGRFAWLGRPNRAALIWMGVGSVILLSTKETFFIFFGTWLIAELCISLMERFERQRRPWTNSEGLTTQERRDLRIDTLAVAGISILVLAALFSGFFEHSQGIEDFFRAFKFWSNTGKIGNGHQKPWDYWLDLLRRYELPLLMGLCVAPLSTVLLSVESRKQRVLLLAGFGHWLAYTIVPYKTPWLILNFWPLAFFSLSFFDRGFGRPRLSRFLHRLILFSVCLYSGWMSWNLNFRDFADPQEPYVYVQTTTDYTIVMNVLRAKVARSPEARNSSIVIMVQDPWPLPYDLSLYPKMRYARLEDLDKDPSILLNADMLLVDGTYLEGLKKVFPKRFARLRFQLRDAYNPGWALFDYEKFQIVLPQDVPVEDAVPESPTEESRPAGRPQGVQPQ